VVVFHDSAAQNVRFGVHRVIRELAPRYPLFEFIHSWGLAVVGAAPPEAIVEFVGAANASPDEYRALFASLGSNCEMLTLVDELIAVQFREMQAVNAIKAKCGLPIEPGTQRIDVALSQPIPFAAHTLRELGAILSRIRVQ